MTQDAAPRPLREVVGEAARKIRETAKRRQDDVARGARLMGLPWSRAKVGALENGAKAVSVEELVTLALVLTQVCGRTIRVPDLLDADDLVILTPHLQVPAREVAKSLAGQNSLGALDPAIALTPAGHKAVLAEVESLAREKRANAELFLLVTRIQRLGLKGDLDAWAAEIGEAEQKTARRLDEPAVVLVALSHELWGRTLSEERDRVADEREPDASPDRRRALRGQVTRALVNELAAELARRDHIAAPVGTDGTDR
ncbi:hypothetical protein [Pseudofrankia inefficax]|uniref:Xre family DNA-binding protein n=1 Tax=Pseudofrankia inefficax (strain DSM 45817 / CECT 9037 / DDB 130130 / EuI1c) TaxID=298654 RepID=E3J644_PSEI1|nr:hypothetical protein [Pseudofrankia inefficax]ADP78335.1 Xre family DNA-binding protein [Pseudofrankia inefficax]